MSNQPSIHPPQGQSRRLSSHRTDVSKSGSTTNRVALSIEPPAAAPSYNPNTGSPAQSIFRVPASPRSAATDPQSKAAKVAIPRLKRSNEATAEDASRASGRHRVNHACEPCRHRKTKCSGEKPVCRHCQDFKITCFYADGKRDRVKKQFGTMAEKVADYERLLKELMDRVPEDDANLIKASLDRGLQTELDDNFTETATIQSVEVGDEGEPSGAESDVSGRAGSTGALDRADEDFTREGAKTTGFMGKNSEVTWMQKLKQENAFGDSPQYKEDGRILANPTSQQSENQSGDTTIPLAEAGGGFSVHDSNYHLDDLAITTYEAVDAYEMPPTENAQILFATYIRRIQPTFPILGQMNLTLQFQRFIANPAQRPPDVWLGIINMIFAISAKYSHLVQADWRGDERDHMIYFTRARLLAVDQDTLFNHPDLQQIQILGLMSFYLLSTGQVNRAWTIAGLAIRAATALGLNMRIESMNLKNSLKEIRYRLWWALYSLESRLCSITGRVYCILDDHCTTPLPCPVDEEKFDSEEGRKLLSQEMQRGDRAPSANSYSSSVPPTTPPEKGTDSTKSEQSKSPASSQPSQSELDWAKDTLPNASLYFLHHVQLTRLTQNVLHRLYNPACIEGSWSNVQRQMKDLNDQLELWYRKLPVMYDFKRRQRDRDFYEARLSLGFFYYGTLQTIYRPCLCRLDRKIPKQSHKSYEFNRNAAMACVEAAQDSLRLIPDEPNAIGLIRVGPWWTILHWVVQSATVLMLEISYRAHHMPEEADNILEASKKAVRWLHALGEDNLSARRAWSHCNTMLHGAAVKIGRDVSDLPDKPPGGGSSNESGTGGMSEFGSMQQPGFMMHPFQQNVNGNHDVFGTDISTYANFSNFDPMMHYDQHFPGGESTNMSMAHDPHTNYVSAQADPAMEYMSNSFHDNGNTHGRDGANYH